MDGPVGDLISQTDISHFRPAHVHFLINVPGFEPPRPVRSRCGWTDMTFVRTCARSIVARGRESPRALHATSGSAIHHLKNGVRT